MYSLQDKFRLIFVIVLIIIVAASMLFTSRLVNKLSAEEHHRMEQLAEATKFVIEASDNQDISFAMSIIQMNTNIPVVIIDDRDNLIDYRNVEIKGKSEEEFFTKKIQSMKEENTPIVIEFSSGEKQYVYYDESLFVKELSYFPIIQLIVIIVFCAVVLYANIIAKRAEQNRVWVGLSKETAHQLGTPISSLLAWVEILKTQEIDSSIIKEMSYDVERLRIIAERFSKIGSKPDLEPQYLSKVLDDSVAYIRTRISQKINVECNLPKEEIMISINFPLFEWVIENICKNAVDAMGGEGEIKINVEKHNDSVFIDISDSGKGISKSQIKKIFTPGYTTKTRGWGLGLTLVKRIVEEYHNGKIYVKSSNLNKGTTFRMVFPLENK
jgi:K+-sensing histidine kinase KdpD